MNIAFMLGVVGLLVISVAIWVRDEVKQDALFIAGGACISAA